MVAGKATLSVIKSAPSGAARRIAPGIRSGAGCRNKAPGTVPRPCPCAAAGSRQSFQAPRRVSGEPSGQPRWPGVRVGRAGDRIDPVGLFGDGQADHADSRITKGFERHRRVAHGGDDTGKAADQSRAYALFAP